MEFIWNQISTLESKKFTCGYCGEKLTSEKGFIAAHKNNSSIRKYSYLCHFCENLTFFDFNGTQSPGIKFGEDVNNISDDLVSKIYDEARNSISTNSFTASVMCCRKLVMHIAVDKGAKDGLRFIEYIDYLENNNFITQGAKEWVDEIRQLGNEANHEIKIMEEDEAKDLISFCEMLLKLNYDYPSRVRKKSNSE